MNQLAAESIAQTPDKPPIIDVWSRTTPKYRRRGVLMFLLLAVLFAGLCCFTYWLRTGLFWPWQSDDYNDLMLRSFRPAGASQVTLSDFLSAPISVKDVPIHGVIMGLLFASLSSIPILVAILYRFPFSVMFAAMVFFLAAMPWLGLTVVAGCALASLPRFRFSFRYASALLGLVPISIYFVMASWEPAGGRVKPVENLALLYAPWVLALLGSCVICAVALAIAKLINYRPGGIAPVLAILFAVPVFLFHSKVGRDELEYRIVERQIGPGSQTAFESQDVGAAADREATRVWSATRDASYDEILRPILAKQLDAVFVDAENDKARAIAMCDSFIERFPKSQYIPNILFLKGQAQDQRINGTRLAGQNRAEFRNDWPSLASQRTWQTLDEQFPRHELTVMALLKLAWLRARQGHLDDALSSVDKLVARFDASRAASQPSADRAGMFQKPSSAQSLGLETELVVRQARRLAEMLRACAHDSTKLAAELWEQPRGSPGAPIHPLSLLLSLDETDPNYETNLHGIVRHFPETRTADYADLRLIALEPAISRRIARLRGAVAVMAGRPAGAEATFRLAEVLKEDSVLDEAHALYIELSKTYPESCWSAEARDRLASLTLAERAGG